MIGQNSGSIKIISKKDEEIMKKILLTTKNYYLCPPLKWEFVKTVEKSANSKDLRCQLYSN